MAKSIPRLECSFEEFQWCHVNKYDKEHLTYFSIVKSVAMSFLPHILCIFCCQLPNSHSVQLVLILRINKVRCFSNETISAFLRMTDKSSQFQQELAIFVLDTEPYDRSFLPL